MTSPNLPVLTVVVPTYDERENVSALVSALHSVLDDAGISHEVLFVDDDSPDGTADVVRAAALADPRVRLIHRIRRRGLASAVVEGIFSAEGEFVAVVDGDLQHDESVLPDMLREARNGADVVVGSRYTGGGGTSDWAASRKRLSLLATRLARRVVGDRTSDPMSGFFLLRTAPARELGRSVEARGFKILAELLAADGSLRVADVPYVFRTRAHGESKLTGPVGEQYLEFLYQQTLGRVVPIRFTKYCLVGFAGSMVHTIVLAAAWRIQGLEFTTSLVLAIEAAIIFNFVMNNRWTFRDRSFRGWALVGGLLRFNLVCAFGALSTYSVSWLLLDRGSPWTIAVPLAASVGVTWNYTMSNLLAWTAPE